jgi:prepilin-type N-terminal cleavage/methylation domain-containing protein
MNARTSTTARGFSLLEAVLAMTIFGVLAAVVAIGFSQGVESFVFARENVALAQKAEIALGRITAEVRTMTSVPLDATKVNATTLTFAAERNGGLTSALALSGARLRLTVPTAGGGTATGLLIDGISLNAGESIFQYFQINDAGGDVAWTPADDVPNQPSRLYKIVVTLRLARPDAPGQTQLFQTAISPNNLSGQPQGPRWR